VAVVFYQEERTIMKQEIHPGYKETKVHCACGESFETRSTKESIRLDICSVCHPFYTGKQKLIDTEGRVDKFRKKYNKA
jgi:large subunit ribosomal protein L31